MMCKCKMRKLVQKFSLSKTNEGHVAKRSNPRLKEWSFSPKEILLMQKSGDVAEV